MEGEDILIPRIRGIVHTAEFYQSLLEVEAIRLEETYKSYITEKSKGNIMFEFGGCIKIILFSRNGFMRIYVDFIELLCNPIIDEKNLREINEKINSICDNIFIYEDRGLVLSRYDARLDVKFDNKNSVDTMIRLLERSVQKIGQMHRDDNPEYIGKSIRFKSSANKSTMGINIYDKEQERIDKARLKGEEVEIAEYEINVLRFEVQLYNPHLNYRKRYYGSQKELESYLNTVVSKEYMDKYIYPIVFNGNYYDLKNAKQLMKEKGLRESEVKKLIEFLKYGEKTNLTITKERFGRYKYETYTNRLNEIDINPVIIPESMKLEYFENYLSGLLIRH